MKLRYFLMCVLTLGLGILELRAEDQACDLTGAQSIILQMDFIAGVASQAYNKSISVDGKTTRFSNFSRTNVNSRFKVRDLDSIHIFSSAQYFGLNTREYISVYELKIRGPSALGVTHMVLCDQNGNLVPDQQFQCLAEARTCSVGITKNDSSIVGYKTSSLTAGTYRLMTHYFNGAKGMLTFKVGELNGL